ncbi:MAG: alpha/beta hydrolase [Dehalococcoidia bacterium]|nr:alpha/beta hydrolase [Dehalococcoidia bacterium]
MPPDEGFIEANGLRLHYLMWYPGSEGHLGFPPLLMLHANGFLARLWQPVAERLASRYHVYAYDVRGHGDSDKPPPADADNYHWRHLVADLRAFMDAFALRDIPVVAHSSGGATAAYLAGTQPGYFSRLVLIEPIIMPPQFRPLAAPRDAMAQAARRRRQVWPGPGEMIESYRKRPTFERWTEECLRLYAEHGTFPREGADGHGGQVQLKCSGEVEARMFENSVSLDVWEVLPDITCPAIVIRGEHTDAFLGSIVDAVAGEIPDARALAIPGADHLAPMEQPEALAKEVLAFLDGGRP